MYCGGRESELRARAECVGYGKAFRPMMCSAVKHELSSGRMAGCIPDFCRSAGLRIAAGGKRVRELAGYGKAYGWGCVMCMLGVDSASAPPPLPSFPATAAVPCTNPAAYHTMRMHIHFLRQPPLPRPVHAHVHIRISVPVCLLASRWVIVGHASTGSAACDAHLPWCAGHTRRVRGDAAPYPAGARKRTGRRSRA